MKTIPLRNRTGTALALAAVVLLGAPLQARERLTLAAATAEALGKSDLLRAEDARVAAAAGAVAAARGQLLPTITLEERFTRTDNPAYDFSLKINQGSFASADLQGAPATFNQPAPISDFQTSLSFSQPLWSRQAALGVQIARTEADAVSHERERRRQDVEHRVLQAWLAAQAAEAYRETAIRAEEDAAEHLRLAGVAESAGTGLTSDRLRAEVALAEARRTRLAVEHDLEIARRGLGLAIGRDEAVVPAPETTAGAEPDLEALLAAAGGRRDLLALAARVDGARLAAAAARAARLPQLGLNGALQANDPDQPLGTSGTSYVIGIGLTWNIFDGRRSRAAEAQAGAGVRQAESYLAALTKETRFRVREAWLRWEEAGAGIAIAEGARAAAEEGVRIVRVRYENGLTPMVALLDAQSALNRARADATSARAREAAALGEVYFRAGMPIGDGE